MLEHSTQYKNWCFKGRDDELKLLTQNKSNFYRRIYQKLARHEPNPKNEKDIQLFGPDDENIILNFYINNISRQCRANFPIKVEATAISFFKRFFLKKPIIDFDPKKYLYTCIYMAIKSEEINKDIEELSRSLNDRYFNKFPEYEEQVLKAINFDIKVYHAFTPLASLFFRLTTKGKLSSDLIQKMHTEAEELARKCFYDYLIFTIPHGVIAICVFLIILKRHQINLADMDMPDLVSLVQEKEAELLQITEEIMGYETKVFGKDEAQKIMEKLKMYMPTEEYPKSNDRLLPPPVKKVERAENPT